MQRAYSKIEFKASEDTSGRRTFTGIATTPSTDRVGDIVEPRGAQVIYPKDLGPILMLADIFPGARVVEAGDRKSVV